MNFEQIINRGKKAINKLDKILKESKKIDDKWNKLIKEETIIVNNNKKIIIENKDVNISIIDKMDFKNLKLQKKNNTLDGITLFEDVDINKLDLLINSNLLKKDFRYKKFNFIGQI
jgi:hypothetical protein